MRLLLDQGLPRSAAKFLREAGIDTVHVGKIGYAAADDATILQRARDDTRTVVTLDADFHALLATLTRHRPVGYSYSHRRVVWGTSGGPDTDGSWAL